jgi:RNA polymerase sigma factor (sigma-70 family)
MNISDLRYYAESLLLEDILPIIIEYQYSNDKRMFYYLLAQFDLLIIGTFKDMTHGPFKHLYEDEHDLELYHIAILGFDQALRKIPKNEDPKKIPAWITAYVKSKIRSFYSYKQKETPADPIEIQQYMSKEIHHVSGSEKDRTSLIDIKTIMERSALTSEECQCITMYHLDRYTLEEVGAEMSMPKYSVLRMLKRAMAKMQRYVRAHENPSS